MPGVSNASAPVRLVRLMISVCATACPKRRMVVIAPRRRCCRSEERRVGKEGRSRGSPYHLKKKNRNRGSERVNGKLVKSPKKTQTNRRRCERGRGRIQREK